MPTVNTQSIQVVNGLISASQQLMALYNQMVTLDQQWTDQNVATVSAAMTTVAQNADGTLGAADGTPNSAHPISLTVYPTMGRAITSTQIGQLKTILDGIVSYVNGQAVTTQASAHAILNVAVGG